MTTSTSGIAFTSEPESFGDEEHNLRNMLLKILAHQKCSSVLQRS